MPVAPLNEARPTAVAATRCILRRIRCTGGVIDMAVEVAPRFESGSFLARFRLVEATHAEVVGGPAASTLLVPAFGLVDTTEPEVARTVEAVTGRLGRAGLLHRYPAGDGLEGREGAFLLCSFWLVDCLAFAGRVDEAAGETAE